jgi:hypothetical protein
VERDSCHWPAVGEPDAELDGSSFVSALATAAVVAAALFLAAMPAAIVLHFLELPVGWVGAGLGSLGAAVGGVKLIAMAWAVGGRLWARPPARAVIAAAD